MNAKIKYIQPNMLDKLFVDYFAGGGGASTGIELAIGRPVDIAVNHDDAAIELHKVNHWLTDHYKESVFDIDLKDLCYGREVALLWGSPDCTHFSVARGGTPVKKEIRGLAWVLVRAAHDVAPDVIMFENVKEILTWGKLRAKRDPKTGRCYKRIIVNGKEQIIVAEKGEVLPYYAQVMEPDPKDKGRIWKKFIAALETLSYTCEWRVLKGCDYGAPTTRQRLFGIFRRDGYPIVWPEPTHGDPNSEAVKNGDLLPWRTAAECIDFSKDTPSIFTRKKPLAEKTLTRIVRGIDKFVIKSGKPFIVPTGYGEKQGQKPRINDIDKPLGTIVSTAKHNIVDPKLTPFINNCQFNNVGSRADEPLPTQLSVRKDFLVTPLLTHYHSATKADEARGTTLDKPIPTLLVKYEDNGNYGYWAQIRDLLNKYGGYSLADDEIILFEIGGDYYFMSDIGMRMIDPEELKLAQGFPPDYVLDRDSKGNPYPKTEQVAKIGNSVCPQIPTALIKANIVEYAVAEKLTTMAELYRRIAV